MGTTRAVSRSHQWTQRFLTLSLLLAVWVKAAQPLGQSELWVGKDGTYPGGKDEPSSWEAIVFWGLCQSTLNAPYSLEVFALFFAFLAPFNPVLCDSYVLTICQCGALTCIIFLAFMHNSRVSAGRPETRDKPSWPVLVRSPS